MDISQLPGESRLKLPDSQEKEFWKRVEQEGGVKSFCEKNSFSASKMYNWRNKRSFLPVEAVLKLLGRDVDIRAVKGNGRGKVIETAKLDFSGVDELVTRAESSVSVNHRGTPMYQTDDIGNLQRFTELLERTGADFHVYSRQSYYQVNYPKFLHRILSERESEEKLGARIDEEAEIDGDFFILDDRKISISGFSGDLHSRRKSARLAVEREDSDQLQKLISAEARKVEKMLGN